MNAVIFYKLVLNAFFLYKLKLWLLQPSRLAKGQTTLGNGHLMNRYVLTFPPRDQHSGVLFSDFLSFHTYISILILHYFYHLNLFCKIQISLKFTLWNYQKYASDPQTQTQITVGPLPLWKNFWIRAEVELIKSVILGYTHKHS